jgi:broad specificity phosphatase PhoE
MTKLLLIRHGHVEGISPPRFRGRADLALTAEGERQAEATARRIKRSWQPSAIYSSPMRRCLSTASAIGRPFSLTPRPLAGLTDIDYGQWQGLTPDEARARWADELTMWYREPDRVTIPAGETLRGVLSRVAAVLGEVIERHPADTVVMVGHDSVNRVLLLHVLGQPLSRYWRIHQHPCAINEIDYEGGSFTIGSINQTDHLLSG